MIGRDFGEVAGIPGAVDDFAGGVERRGRFDAGRGCEFDRSGDEEFIERFGTLDVVAGVDGDFDGDAGLGAWDEGGGVREGAGGDGVGLGEGRGGKEEEEQNASEEAVVAEYGHGAPAGNGQMDAWNSMGENAQGRAGFHKRLIFSGRLQ